MYALDELNKTNEENFNIEIQILIKGLKCFILERIENPTQKDINITMIMLRFLGEKILLETFSRNA